MYCLLLYPQKVIWLSVSLVLLSTFVCVITSISFFCHIFSYTVFLISFFLSIATCICFKTCVKVHLVPLTFGSIFVFTLELSSLSFSPSWWMSFSFCFIILFYFRYLFCFFLWFFYFLYLTICLSYFGF